jgi:outer membrane protein, adhesin transport system
MTGDDAISRHPSVEAARRLVLSAEANVKAARANRAPRVDLQTTAGAYGASVVTFTWPAFDLSRSAAEDAAVASLLGSRANLLEQERIIRERQQTSVQSWIAALRRERVAQGQIGLAQEVVDVYRAQFQIGRRNLLDLLNAFAELSNSEVALESAKVDISLARYQLEYAVGRLSTLVEERRP